MKQQSRRSAVRTISAGGVILMVMLAAPSRAQQPDLIHSPYQLDTGLTTRSISFENPTGAAGAGAKEASNLGVGRKGSPSRTIAPGQTVQMCDVEGPGTIRHIWVTANHDPTAPLPPMPDVKARTKDIWKDPEKK